MGDDEARSGLDVRAVEREALVHVRRQKIPSALIWQCGARIHRKHVALLLGDDLCGGRGARRTRRAEIARHAEATRKSEAHLVAIFDWLASWQTVKADDL